VSNGSGSFAIGKAASTVTVTFPTAAQTYTGGAIDACSAKATGAGSLDQVLTVGYSNNVNVGTASASASYAGDSNHDDSNGSELHASSKAASRLTLTCPTAAQ